MYFNLSLMMIGEMLCSSLKTSDVLEVKAAALFVPGIGATDVGVYRKNRSYLAFLGQRYERWGGVEKTEIFYFLTPSSTAFSKTSFVQGFLKIQYEVDTEPPVP